MKTAQGLIEMWLPSGGQRWLTVKQAHWFKSLLSRSPDVMPHQGLYGRTHTWLVKAGGKWYSFHITQVGSAFLAEDSTLNEEIANAKNV